MNKIKLWVKAGLTAADTMLEQGKSLYSQEDRELLKIDLSNTLLVIIFLLVGLGAVWHKVSHQTALWMAGGLITFSLAMLWWHWAKIHWRIARSLMPKRPFWTRDERFGVWFCFVIAILTGGLWYWVGSATPLIVRGLAVFTCFTGLWAGILFSIRGIKRWRNTGRGNLPPD